jgi:hypothetical protein
MKPIGLCLMEILKRVVVFPYPTVWIVLLSANVEEWRCFGKSICSIRNILPNYCACHNNEKPF